MANPFASERLTYRAVETPDDDKFFQQIGQDPFSFQNSTPSLVRPQARREVMRHQKFLMEEALIGVMICLPTKADDPNPITIGTINMSRDSPYAPQHRTGTIGLNILPEYQGKGYGTEAIRWILEWAFRRAALHRVVIQCFEWNAGARRLYERIGFKFEGVGREHYWHDGRYWDDYSFGMLDREWEEIKTKEASK